METSSTFPAANYIKFWPAVDFLLITGPGLRKDASCLNFRRHPPTNFRKHLGGPQASLLLSQDVRKFVFDRFPWKPRFYSIHEAHEQYSLLDTILNYIFCFGLQEKVGKNQANLLYVGRFSRPACNGFRGLEYR